jgi:hypothetical protein
MLKLGIIDAGGVPSVVEVAGLDAAATVAASAIADGAQAVFRHDVDGVGARVSHLMR